MRIEQGDHFRDGQYNNFIISDFVRIFFIMVSFPNGLNFEVSAICSRVVSLSNHPHPGKSFTYACLLQSRKLCVTLRKGPANLSTAKGGQNPPHTNTHTQTHTRRRKDNNILDKQSIQFNTTTSHVLRRRYTQTDSKYGSQLAAYPFGAKVARIE